jgi:hypothetical protein
MFSTIAWRATPVESAGHALDEILKIPKRVKEGERRLE